MFTFRVMSTLFNTFYFYFCSFILVKKNLIGNKKFLKFIYVVPSNLINFYFVLYKKYFI